MNADTGAVYRIGTDLDQPDIYSPPPINGDLLGDLRLRAETAGRPLSDEESAAAEAQARGEQIVRVSEQVVQRLRLGDRELRRRRQRR